MVDMVVDGCGWGREGGGVRFLTILCGRHQCILPRGNFKTKMFESVPIVSPYGGELPPPLPPAPSDNQGKLKMALNMGCFLFQLFVGIRGRMCPPLEVYRKYHRMALYLTKLSIFNF